MDERNKVSLKYSALKLHKKKKKKIAACSFYSHGKRLGQQPNGQYDEKFYIIMF